MLVSAEKERDRSILERGASGLLERFGLYSVMALLEFRAHAFCHAFSTLGAIGAYLESRETVASMGVAADINEKGLKYLGSALGSLMQDCETLGLPVSLAQLNRMMYHLDEYNWSDIRNSIRELQHRVIDELESQAVVMIPGSLRTLYQSNPFDPSVVERFPSATFDMVEAGKCLALGMSTSSVYHLMRILEAGLHSLGSFSGARAMNARLPNWKPIIQGIDKELKKDYSTEERKFSADELSFLAESSALFMAVKDAWRNPTMHLDKTYSDGHALEILHATRGFMRHLSKGLSETLEQKDVTYHLSTSEPT